MPPAPKMKFEALTVKKVVADVTKRFYITNLNKIASGGFSTVKELLDNSGPVLDIVKSQPADRQKGMMNAIFYALSDHPNTQTVSYYNYFQVLKGKDPKYVEHQKKEEEKKAAAPPAPAAPAKRKYTKTAKFFSQPRLKKIQKTVEAVVDEINAHIKSRQDKKTSDEVKNIQKIKASLEKRLQKIKDEIKK